MPIKKQKNGTYRVDVSLGYVNGVRKRTSRNNIKTLKEAKSIERRLHEEHERVTYAFKKYDTVFLIEEYLKDTAKSSKETSNLKRVSTFRNHIIPFFENTKIKQIKALDIKKFYDYLLENQKLSNNYKRYVFTYLSSFFNWCVRFEYINSNPTKAVNNFKKQRVDIEYWDLQMYMKFINVVDDLRYKTLFNTMYLTGMRKGEALGLTWDKIDLVNKTINITQQVVPFKKVGYKVTTPKSENGIREITISVSLVNILSEYKDYMKKIEYKFSDSNFVFAQYGELPKKTTLTRKFKHWIKVSGVKNIRMHSLRHSFASLCINELGISALELKERMGHSGVEISLNVYSKLFPSTEKETMNKLDNLLSISNL